jgi:hypothetical protein
MDLGIISTFNKKKKLSWWVMFLYVQSVLRNLEVDIDYSLCGGGGALQIITVESVIAEP